MYRNLPTVLLATVLSLFHPIAETSSEVPPTDDAAVLVAAKDLPDGKTPKSAKTLARIYLPPSWAKPKEWKCLVTLWNHESGWRYNADNPTSSAYGIPQILGLDEDLSPRQQILRGFRYIDSRYGSPCEAWEFWKSKAKFYDGDYHGGWY